MINRSVFWEMFHLNNTNNTPEPDGSNSIKCKSVLLSWWADKSILNVLYSAVSKTKGSDKTALLAHGEQGL